MPKLVKAGEKITGDRRFSADVEILARVSLRDEHRSTGSVRHFSDGGPMPRPTQLELLRFPPEKQVYLIYLDSAGGEMNDDLFDTAEEAMESAREQFSIENEDWKDV